MTFFIVLCIICGIIYGAFIEKPLANKRTRDYKKEQRERGLY